MTKRFYAVLDVEVDADYHQEEMASWLAMALGRECLDFTVYARFDDLLSDREERKDMFHEQTSH